MVFVCLQVGDRAKALEYVERSKARSLVELLAHKKIYPKRELYANPEDYQRICDLLDKLRRDIPAKQRELEVAGDIWESDLRDRIQEQVQADLKELQRARDNLLEDIKQRDPAFKLTQQVNPILFPEIQSLIDRATAIVEWYIIDERLYTFIITRHSSQPEIIQSSPEDLKSLSRQASMYLRLYYRKSGKKWWLQQLPPRLLKLAQTLHLDEIIAKIPLECKQLILIPNRFLYALPLHALPLGESDRSVCLLDRFPAGVRYTPSCLSLQLTQNRHRPDFSNLLAVQNPTSDLGYANLEVETIRSFFPNQQVLVKQMATKAAFLTSLNSQEIHCGHFSCHGEFNLVAPLESGLIFANGERLTLAEIFGLSLDRCRAIVLSACETGLVDFTNIGDEYVGLPSGFLYAGSSSTVNSLWVANDLSTAFLMIRFYHNLVGGCSVTVALNRAQLWLRDVTKVRLEAWIAENSLKLEPTLKINLRRRLHQMSDRDRPFESPFHWAAFCAIGA